MADLPANQMKFLTALLAAPSLAVAAQHCDLSDRTASRFMADPNFVYQYRRAQREALFVATAKLSSLTGAAVATLQATLVDPTAPPAVRLAACKIVLDTALRWSEHDDLEERIATLEGAQHGVPSGVASCS